jgi:hypothetical protein
MKVKVVLHEWHAEIFPDSGYADKFCMETTGSLEEDPGNVCVWFMIGPRGPECTIKNKNIYTVNAFKDSRTIAKRDGCDGEGNPPLDEYIVE